MFGLAHTVFKSLWTFKHQQTSFKSWISTFSWKKQKILGVCSHKVPVNYGWVPPAPEEPALSGSPQSQELSHCVNLASTHIWVFNTRHSAGCLAHGKLSGTGRPLLSPPKKSKRMKLPYFVFRALGCPVSLQGRCSTPAPPLLSQSTSSFSLWTQA